MDKKYYIIGGILAVLLIIAGIFLFSSSGKPKINPNQKITLTWWMTFEDSGNIQDILTDYQKVNKNVTINFVKKDAATYQAELVNALAAGVGPDIFTIHNDWLAKQADKIVPMSDKVMSLRTYNDTFVDVASSDFIKDNKIYAMPISVDVLALYYNKDILNSAGISQPPTTWPELIDDVQKITRSSKPGDFSRSGIALGSSTNVNRAVDILSLLMLQFGTKFYSNDFNTATFDSTQDVPGSNTSFNPGVTGLEFYTQFSNPAKTAYTWNSRSDLSIDAFTQGKVAMMLSYQYMEPLIRAKAPNLNWGVAVVPQTGEDVTKVNFANYWGLTVSKASPNADTAWNFLNFMTQKAELTKYYALHKIPASRKDILNEQISDADLGVFAESALTARSVYKKNAEVFEGVFLKMIDNVTLKNFEPDQAISDAASEINLDLGR